MYTNILLDLDNTIFDFDLDEEESFIKTIEDLGLDYRPDYLDNYRKINSQLWPRLEKGEISLDQLLNTRFSLLFKIYNMELDGRKLEQIFRSHLANSSNLIPGAKTSLLGLKSKGLKLYSASNGIYKTQLKRLDNSDLLELFSGHFISGDLGYDKPSPEFFQACLKELAPVSKSSILMVGDNPVADIYGAHQAGLDSCLFQKNKPSQSSLATYEIQDLRQLLDLVD